MDYRQLRQSKIILKKDKKELTKSDILDLIKKSQNFDERWFFLGCKHILERHYTEAIKNLQLSNTKDAILLILAISFKTVDTFLIKEYIEHLNSYEEDKEDFKILSKYSITPVLKFKNKEVILNLKNTIDLISSVFNR